MTEQEGMNTSDTVKRLTEKSKESFSLAIELYNRPTLKYHAEACSIFLCNAWELMLKAYLIKTQGISSIYFKDNPERTISLDDCLGKVFTNSKSPLRINMRELIDFRNTNTHFITDEWEIFYGPFLQAAVTNYAQQLEELLNESVSDLMPENHLTLAVRRGDVQPDIIHAKYDPAVAKRLLKKSHELAEAAGTGGNENIAAIYETTLRIVKKERDADLNVYFSKGSDIPVNVIRDVKDSRSYYPYTAKLVLEKVNHRLKRENIDLIRDGKPHERFNKYDFGLFTSGHNMKGDERFSYDRSSPHESNPAYIYNDNTVNFIVQRLKEEPDYLDNLKQKSSKNNRH
ncbi:DUF3644 domain-containing protein [Corynebacterium kefirresidentii]|uniref:DUF3644 domain-containing protein n=1 Tax=Corynebacterium TaxID=1716 RepID=UPI001E33F587|nr:MULTISPECIES: DUF3644 domain-containing protein [Corynebacterium]WKS53743.1 DUF3644 domain-containing protein [Corynebacterium tuberculostearicum]